MTPKQLLTRMGEGYAVTRRIENSREQWRAQPNGEAVSARVVRKLIAKGWASGHYPPGTGSLNLTQEGEAEYRKHRPAE